MYLEPIPSPTTTMNRSSRSRPYSSCNDGTGLAVDTPDRSADHWQDACRKGAAGGHKQSVASEPQVLTAQSQWAMCQINWAPGHDGSSHGRRAARCPRTAAAAWIPAPWWSSSVLDGSASLTNWSTISTYPVRRSHCLPPNNSAIIPATIRDTALFSCQYGWTRLRVVSVD